MIENLSKIYNVKSLCDYLEVNRSSYYKWLNNKGITKTYQSNRKDLIEMVASIHKEKPSYGYRRPTMNSQ